MQERVAIIEEWQEQFTEAFKEHKELRAERDKDFEARLRRLERALYLCTGAIMLAEVLLRFLFK